MHPARTRRWVGGPKLREQLPPTAPARTLRRRHSVAPAGGRAGRTRRSAGRFVRELRTARRRDAAHLERVESRPRAVVITISPSITQPFGSPSSSASCNSGKCGPAASGRGSGCRPPRTAKTRSANPSHLGSNRKAPHRQRVRQPWRALARSRGEGKLVFGASWRTHGPGTGRRCMKYTARKELSTILRVIFVRHRDSLLPSAPLRAICSRFALSSHRRQRLTDVRQLAGAGAAPWTCTRVTRSREARARCTSRRTRANHQAKRPPRTQRDSAARPGARVDGRSRDGCVGQRGGRRACRIPYGFRGRTPRSCPTSPPAFSTASSQVGHSRCSASAPRGGRARFPTVA